MPSSFQRRTRPCSLPGTDGAEFHRPVSCSSKCLAYPQSGACGSRQLPHPIQLEMQLSASCRSKFIRLFFPRGIFLVEALDPAVLEKSAKRAVKGARAQRDPAVAEGFNILHQRVPVAGLRGQAHQDQQDRLSQGFSLPAVTSLCYMSHDDILKQAGNDCQADLIAIDQESRARTFSLNAFPSTRFPASFACTAFITTPICFGEVTPVS